MVQDPTLTVQSPGTPNPDHINGPVQVQVLRLANEPRGALNPQTNPWSNPNGSIPTLMVQWVSYLMAPPRVGDISWSKSSGSLVQIGSPRSVGFALAEVISGAEPGYHRGVSAMTPLFNGRDGGSFVITPTKDPRKGVTSMF